MAYGYPDPGTGGMTTTGGPPGGGAGGGFTDFLKGNPDLATGLGVGAATLPLFLNKGGNLPYQGPQQAIAQQAGSDYSYNAGEARALEDPLTSGNLPPGAKAQVQQYLQQATNNTKQRYAALGLTGSTMEADQLSQVQQNQSVIEFQIAEQMFKSGIDAGNQALGDLKLENSIYGDLMNAQLKQDQGLAAAIGNFAGAAGKAFGLGGGGGGAGAAAGGSLSGAVAGGAGAEVAGDATLGSMMAEATPLLAVL